MEGLRTGTPYLNVRRPEATGDAPRQFHMLNLPAAYAEPARKVQHVKQRPASRAIRRGLGDTISPTCSGHTGFVENSPCLHILQQ
ncbi:hypothetical protein D3C87_1481250 [compost metagenome]